MLLFEFYLFKTVLRTLHSWRISGTHNPSETVKIVKTFILKSSMSYWLIEIIYLHNINTYICHRHMNGQWKTGLVVTLSWDYKLKFGSSNPKLEKKSNGYECYRMIVTLFGKFTMWFTIILLISLNSINGVILTPRVN